MTRDFVPACEPRGVTDGGRIGQLPNHIVGDYFLPLHGIGNKGLNVPR